MHKGYNCTLLTENNPDNIKKLTSTLKGFI